MPRETTAEKVSMIFHQPLRFKPIPLEDELLVTYFGSSTVPYCADPLQINTISFYTRFYRGPNRSTNNSFYNLSSGLNRSPLRKLVRTSIKLLFCSTQNSERRGYAKTFPIRKISYVTPSGANIEPAFSRGCLGIKGIRAQVTVGKQNKNPTWRLLYVAQIKMYFILRF